MMSRRVLALLFCLATLSTIARADDHDASPVTTDTRPIAAEAPATVEQVERLLEVVQVPKMIDSLLPIMQQRMESSFMNTMADRLSPDQQQAARRMLERQMASMRELLAWENLRPVYVRVYTQTFSAAEVQGMIDFYDSPVGRSALAKMPNVMEASMREMQPLLDSTLRKVMADLERDIQQATAASGQTP